MRLTKKRYIAETLNLLYPFVHAFSTVIDERVPYHANHTRNMVKYGKRFILYLNKTNNCWRFSPEKEKLFLMSIWLHDIGKIIVPVEILNKNTRLGERLERINCRFEKIELLWELDYVSGKISEEEFKCLKAKLKLSYQFILTVNHARVILSKSDQDTIRSIASETYHERDGTIRNWLSEEEAECLLIIRGTLTKEERSVIENHVVMTERILNEIKVSPYFKQVIYWASSHHEFLDGSGYPKHLSGDEISKEVRLMTILDIFDALTAQDRPYKLALTMEDAFLALDTMVEEGKLDGSILQIFKESMALRQDL